MINLIWLNVELFEKLYLSDKKDLSYRGTTKVQ